jgi:alpha-glucosidase
VLLLTLRGTPFLYYGEELGMGDVPIPPVESIDPPAARVGPDFAWWDRSQSRTPMPWTADRGAGFTTARPWLRLADDADRRNVAAQLADPDSVLACYRRALAARAAEASLQDGSIALLRTGDPDVVAYRRSGSGRDVLVLVAFGSAGATVRLPRRGARAWRPVAGTHRDRQDPIRPGDPVVLRPFEAIVVAGDEPG